MNPTKQSADLGEQVRDTLDAHAPVPGPAPSLASMSRPSRPGSRAPWLVAAAAVALVSVGLAKRSAERSDVHEQAGAPSAMTLAVRSAERHYVMSADAVDRELAQDRDADDPLAGLPTERIDIELHDAPVGDVLMLLSDISQHNLVMPSCAEGTVDVALHNAPIPLVFDVLADMFAFRFVRNGPTTLVIECLADEDEQRITLKHDALEYREAMRAVAVAMGRRAVVDACVAGSMSLDVRQASPSAVSRMVRVSFQRSAGRRLTVETTEDALIVGCAEG